MKKTLKPAHARVPVAKPDGSQLALEGERVSMNVYWHRRLADGSVVEVPDAPEVASASDSQQPARQRQRSKQ